MSKAPKAAEPAVVNEGFGVVLPGSMNADLTPKPPVSEEETFDERMARLQKLADKEIAKESDEEIVKRLVAEARTKRDADLLPKDTSGWPAEYLKVNIFKGPNKFDLSYVPLGLNGYIIKVPRGETVILPKIFVDECLEHAIEEITVQSQGGLITQPRHRFPYQVIGTATTEEYKEYQVQQKEKAARELRSAERMSA